ncbi:BTB/POZ domain-containing protein At1g55760-like isoform X2 [Stegodyphus dumicola]|uniref:BTB/POZ domain-containing protein At1g55760-like isoform X2 n=1 Tax=Stegodyphus dumicola TaxID=202533 RepID=UPI0015AD2BFD|nr:BTB/POZ domain-containing protein At1g55760-like isoform X2 [Stegodyphus dumicola]
MKRSEPSGDQKFDEVDDIRTSVSRLLQRTLLTDVEFHVFVGTSERVFPAHKLILACRSPILADKFYKEKATYVIFESDVGPLGIEQMIRYINSDELVSCSVSDLKQTLKVATKFGIKSLQNLCVSRFTDLDINADNVFEVLEAADFVRHEEVRQKCMKVLINYTEAALNSSAFKDASLATVLCMFRLTELNIYSESCLLEAAISWLKHNPTCSKN